MSRAITSVNQFEKILRDARGQQIPVLIKVFRPSCPACKAVHTEYENLARTFSKNGRFLNINCDQLPEITSSVFDVESIPTFIILDDQGRQVFTSTGSDLKTLVSKMKNVFGHG